MRPEAVLTLEAVSPLFIGGADPRGDPGPECLRAPSLRGALRYWLRAVVSADDPGRLREAEAELFGSANHPSPLGLRVESMGPPRIKTWGQIKAMGEPMTQQRPGPGARPPVSGLGYLGDVALRKTREESERRAIAAGSRFRVVLRWRAAGAASDGDLARLAATLWLFGRLGGLGTRARRGFGALQVREVVDGGFLAAAFEAYPPVVAARSATELAAELTRLAPSLSSLRVGRGASDGYPNLSVCEVAVPTEEFRSPYEALEWMGGRYRSFRDGVRPLERRIPFGLPIPRRGAGPITVDHLNRRASPLRFRPVLLATGSYAMVAVLFRDRLFPQHPSSHRVIEEFLESLNGPRVRF